MKHLLVFAALIGLNLFAKDAPKAYRSAQMEETDASGYVIQTFAYVQNTLTEMKRKDRTVSFELNETSGPPPCTGPVCPMMPAYLKQTIFERVRKSLTDCGSTKFVGYASDKKMILIDHSTRVCDDLRPHAWEMKVVGPPKSIRYFRGNPQSIGDTKCNRYTENTVCMMLYSPATCAYGKTTAQGSNSCFAIAELKKALCEKGENADAIQEDQIICSIEVAPMCPIPMCAAPPENCHNEASNELDSNGCPKHPCGILKCNP